MTPFEWTRGRLLATVASLLVRLAGQALKWQEPISAAAETIHRLLGFASGLKKLSLRSETPCNAA